MKKKVNLIIIIDFESIIKYYLIFLIKTIIMINK